MAFMNSVRLAGGQHTQHRGVLPALTAPTLRARQPLLHRRTRQPTASAAPEAAGAGHSSRAHVAKDAMRTITSGSASAGLTHRESAAGGSGAGNACAQQFDFLVLGSGIAGLTYALKVAPFGSVAIITKKSAKDGCTQYAQGGVCAVLDASDTVQNHIHDTVVAGGFLNNISAVDAVCREGPARVMELVELGAQFTRGAGGQLHLTREGGHSHRRIVHAADVTGREIERALLAEAAAQPNIHFYEHHLAVDLVMGEAAGVPHCFGVDVLDQAADSMLRFVAPVTMLATGGGGQVFPHTTNPGVATGDGMAMAHRAKAVLANMEFVQFHPTSLYQEENVGGRSFLISEAVRGEGGMLFNQAGKRFMSRYDERLELAPRDVVARSIHDQLLQHDQTHVLLDISHRPSAEVLTHFPNIAARCAEAGIDITREPIPVVPAQHYMCGGVQTGLYGETNLAGLYACGEVACTGLHGANRLASNSLLEGLVFAHRAVQPSVAHHEYAMKAAAPALAYAAAAADFVGSRAARPLPVSAAAWVASKRSRLTQLMWKAAGIVRNTDDLKAALQQLAGLYVEARALSEAYGVNAEVVELRNLVTIGELVVSSALQRKESRGLHFTTSYPLTLAPEEAHETVIKTALKRRFDLSEVSNTTAFLPHVALRRSTFARAARNRKKQSRELMLRSQAEELE